MCFETCEHDSMDDHLLFHSAKEMNRYDTALNSF